MGWGVEKDEERRKLWGGMRSRMKARGGWGRGEEVGGREKKYGGSGGRLKGLLGKLIREKRKERHGKTYGGWKMDSEYGTEEKKIHVKKGEWLKEGPGKRKEGKGGRELRRGRWAGEGGARGASGHSAG